MDQSKNVVVGFFVVVCGVCGFGFCCCWCVVGLFGLSFVCGDFVVCLFECVVVFVFFPQSTASFCWSTL